jgi:hypothetical protein
MPCPPHTWMSHTPNICQMGQILLTKSRLRRGGTHNLGAATVRAGEALFEAALLGLDLLHVVDVLHVRDVSVEVPPVVVSRGGGRAQRILGLLESTVANEPPGACKDVSAGSMRRYCIDCTHSPEQSNK